MKDQQFLPGMSFRSSIAALCVSLGAMCWALAPGAAAQVPEWLLGDWVLNAERTHEEQPKRGGGLDLGSFGSSVSIGGVGIPMPGGATAAPAGSPRDPRILRCPSMTVSVTERKAGKAEQALRFAYDHAGEEVMTRGNDQGRRTKWNARKLTQSYATTSRKVTKSLALQKDGSLLVEVTLNPKGAKSVTHVRVFERPPAEPPESPGP